MADKKKNLQQELENADAEHGGGPQTDREKERREKFIELWTQDAPPAQESQGSTETTTEPASPQSQGPTGSITDA
jgi:hypothetical protein